MTAASGLRLVFVATMSRDYNPNGGMYVATSDDGVHFTNAANDATPVYAPETGVRDPSVIWYQGLFRMVYTHGWPGESVPKVLCLATSPDMVHWTPQGTIHLGKPTGNNIVDVPQWIIDPAGGVHIICCIDDTHEWVEVRAASADSAAWGDAASWTAPARLRDANGAPLVQGNSFVAYRAGVWYMIFDPFIGADWNKARYYLRTSADFVAGWSDPVLLDLDSVVNGGDAENVLFLPGGAMRFYVSNGNRQNHQIWHLDSLDNGLHWTSPGLLSFEGFGTPRFVNWAQIAMLTDASAIAALRRRG